MSASTLSERLGRFAKRAHDASCDLELHHQSRGLVARVDRGESAEGGDVEQMARDHAASLHGRQGYELRAVFAEGGTKQSLPFRIDGGENSEDAAMPEPATERGMLATLQRQNDRLLTSIERSQKPLTDALSTLGEMLRRCLEQQNDLLKQQIEIASLTAEREADARKDALSDKKWDSLERRFGPLVDAMTAKWLPAATPKKDLCLKFAESLDGPQRAFIMGLLRPEQAALLQAQKFAELIASLIESDQMAAILPRLRPEQVALLDAIMNVKEGDVAPPNGKAEAAP